MAKYLRCRCGRATVGVLFSGGRAIARVDRGVRTHIVELQSGWGLAESRVAWGGRSAAVLV